MAKKVMFVPNKYFHMASFFALVTLILVCQGLRDDNLFGLLASILFGIAGLYFIKKSKNFRKKSKKKK